MENKERAIVDQAITRFEEQTGLKLRIFPGNNGTDILLKIENYEILLNAQVKIFVNRTRLGLTINQLKNNAQRILLITEYINPELMETIEENEINFIDAAGNAYLKVFPLFIKIKGNKPVDTKKTKIIERPFQTAALQTIFTLLCNPGIENEPVRYIAEKAGVTHGTVHLTLKDIERQGYLHNQKDQMTLINKETLLEKWVTLYPEKLKKKFLIGRYTLDIDKINTIDFNRFNALWGGEEAAAKLTNFLRPYIYTIYLKERQGEFILRNRLKQDPYGNLVLMKKFWNFENAGYPGLTHPILIYADLLATGDPRNIETAKFLYEKEVIRYI